MGNSYLFLADGFEEVEALTTVDLLRRAEIPLKTVSIGTTSEVTGAHKIRVIADLMFKEVSFDEADMIILPGGMPGTKNLENFKPLMDKVDEFARKGKNIAAICAAPTVLGRRGILKGRKACCYPNMEGDLLEAEVSYENAVTDNNIITGRGVGCAIDFSLEIIKKLKGEETAKAISKGIVYK